MKRSELAALVVINIGGRTDKTSTINQGLNFGLKEYSQIYDFKTRKVPEDSVNLVKGIGSYTIPSSDVNENIPRILEIRLINGTESHAIIIKDKKWITDRWPNPGADNDSIPAYAYQENEVLHFVPYPDSAYEIAYTYIPDEVDFSGDAEENPLYLLDNSLVSYATAFAFDSMELFQQGARWKQKADRQAGIAFKRDQRTFEKRVAQGFLGVSLLSDNNIDQAGYAPTVIDRTLET